MIELKEITGVFTNADQEDPKSNLATVLQNYRPVNGLLRKTFGLGELIPVTVGSSIINLTTYFNQHLTAGSGKGSGTGYVIIAIAIDATTCAVTLKYWTGTAWESIGTLASVEGSFYHVYSKNPIIQKNEILRILPGAGGLVGSGSNEAIGIWMGWIERSYFDDTYEPGPDYSEGLFLYPITLTSPNIAVDGLNAVVTIVSGGTWMAADNIKWYKLSYLYDGENESLLSDEIRAIYTDNTYLQLVLDFDMSDFNKRITGVNVYRSDVGNIGDVSNEIDGSYELIHSIDLTRDTDLLIKYNGTDAVSGKYQIYIPDIPTIDLDPFYYYIRLAGSDNDWYQIYTPYSSTRKVFGVSKKMTFGGSPLADYVDEDYNNVAWQFRSGNVDGDPSSATLRHEGSSAAYAGDLFAFVDRDGDKSYTSGALVGSLFKLGTSPSYIRVISANDKKYVRYPVTISEFTNMQWAWEIITVVNGLYYFVESGLHRYLYFFDSELTTGATYSILNEPSIKVNGEFAIIHLGKLWQGNLILDPGGKNEAHPDWISDSELDQLDVNPVSNVTKITDDTGYEITGLATSFGSLIILKRSSIHKLQVPDITDSSSRRLLESSFNRGNVAKKGFIQVGQIIYFCATDGIYGLDVNFEAAADETPLIYNRISEAINDIYLAISDKTAIKVGYDRIYTEIIYRFTSTSIWAFNITTKNWREIDTAKTCDVIAYDNNNNLMIFNESDDKIYSITEEEAVGSCVATKFFNITGDTGGRTGLIRSVSIRYKSAVELTVKCYLNGSSSSTTIGTLAASPNIITSKMAIRLRCHSFKIEIIDTTTTTNETEIYNIKLETN